ncbi:alpha-2-macroglobulin family protein [Parabacteroides sp. PF5-9]|uniref:alpha-2-macroglobulin family protein n=1 Tax=Parabacteroides sp. PF5-9 TaxID=1742404 RepID=UPI002476CC0F|nr:alpha-2-macroglobulin family protein [Parabacteroides sp. PF5-9]MDH6357121.1 hypothetical protein [Parabacteroides sp. PF5-9]
MKIRATIVSVLILCGISLFVIYIKAGETSKEERMISTLIEEHNTPELIKALITHMQDELEKDNDRFPELIQEVEAFTTKTSGQASVALLHSILAEMYDWYYQQNRWQVTQRTALTGFIPDDIREWSANLFEDKIQEELTLSLQPADLLQQTPVTDFKELLIKGKDSPELRPTLYDFLAYRALAIHPSYEIYEKLLSFRQQQPQRKAALMVELDYLNYQYQQGHFPQKYTDYITALESLNRLYADEDFSIEILIAQLNQTRYLPDDGRLNTDSLQTQRYHQIKEAISRFPGYERINLLKNELASMEEPFIASEMPNTVYPGQYVELKLTYKNITGVTVQLFESKRQPIDLMSYNSPDEEAVKGSLVKELAFSLPIKNTYSSQDTILRIPVEKAALYECIISASDKEIKNRHTLSVTRLAAVSRQLASGKAEVFVTDFKSGKPISGAEVYYFGGQRRYLQLLGTVETDKNGIAVLPDNKEIYACQPILPGDTWARVASVYLYRYHTEPQKDKTKLSLFTDRGLYRPGQTVFFKGIAYIPDTENPKVVTKESFTVSLRDANNKEVTRQQLTTNEFGSFNGEFILPKQALNGTFRIEAGDYSTYIRVEEYKRPTFKVDFLPVKEEIAFGDEVRLNGKVQTFSGASLQSGEVTWRITRTPLWPRMGWGGQTEQVGYGTTTVTGDGSFSFVFKPEKREQQQPLWWSLYERFEVTATVTDSKGETQEAYSLFSVGEASILLSTNLPEQVDKNKTSVLIDVQTLNGERTDVSGLYTVVSLEENGKNQYGSPMYKEDKLVTSGQFTSGEELPSWLLSKFPSGRYRLKMEAADSKGRTAKQTHDFVLYGKQDKRPPVFSHTWILNEKTTCMPGEEAEIIFGSSDKDVFLLYELHHSNGLFISRSMVKLNNENKTFRIPFKANYGDGIVASFTFVKEGQLYASQVPIYRKRPNRQLYIKTETFRDRLLPGNKEVWKFKVVDNDSLPAVAEVLAGMYDISLDQIQPFNWSFNPTSSINVWLRSFEAGIGFYRNHESASGTVDYLEVKNYEFDQLDWQNVLDRHVFYNMAPSTRSMGGLSMMRKEADVLAENMVEEAVADSGVAMDQATTQSENGKKNSQTSIRQNFNETAFFYPVIRTNETGDFILSFTMPESNTTWKLQTVTHTADLKFGNLTKEVITSKPLMVLPNLPRFMRQGDQVSIATQVINQSEGRLKGNVRLELFDPATEKAIVGLSIGQQSFDLAAGGNTSVDWTIAVPANMELIGLRIVADSEEGSDGEQHLIPVLSNQLFVTESTPFYLLKKGEKQLQINSGKNSRKPFRMTLELSSNPAWYAVQALPTISTPENENILSWFAAYYSNTLAVSMVNEYPQLQQVIRQWSIQGGNAETLLSNLEKNEELKNILLEETPWVMEAKNETEQKQRLSLLFDLNRASFQREAALQQLLQQQTEEGGWSWFKGLNSSRSITLSILKGMKQLAELGAVQYGQEEKEMQMRALKYLDQTIQKEYESLKKQNEQWRSVLPSPEQLEFLYVRSGYRDIPELGDAREAIRFYTDQAEKQWSKYDLKGKGEIALLMHRNGKKDVATAILAWLRKTATTSEEMGMYWANNRRGTNYFTSPIDVHTQLMFVFHELGADQTETDRMKQWLLNQKRTQSWESVPATVNAVYAILLTGSDWLMNKNTVAVEWNNQVFNSTEGEAATGYIKRVAEGDAITSQASSVNIRKTGEAPAWGAVYHQYFEDLDKVSGQKGVLNVEKKLFVETNSGSERQIRPADHNALRVGDKVIVRLTVRTDRDMDYVYLKDLRAGSFEPADQLSGVSYRDGVFFYRSPKDLSENFFFEHLPKGTFVIEYPVYVSRSGEYAGGISTIQCLYAPEFVSHTEGDKLVVRK